MTPQGGSYYFNRGAIQRLGVRRPFWHGWENDILREYLQRKAREVINMLTVEYDYATDRDRA